MPARTHEVDLKPVCLVLPIRSLRSTSFHPELRSLRHDKPFLLSVRATFDSNDSMGVRVLGLVCSPPPPGLFHILEVGHPGCWRRHSGMPQVVAFWKLSLPDVP